MVLRIALLATVLPLGLSFPALAAELPAGAAPPAGAQVATSLDGIVRAFTLAADGAVNGLLLDNGAEVHLSPTLAGQLERAVKPGDNVHVQGWRTPTPGVVDATSVTDARTGRAVVAQASPPRPALDNPREEVASPIGLPPPGAKETTVQGRVLRPLHGPGGALDGAVLGDGTELRLPARAAADVAKLLEPGSRVAVQGYALSRPQGQVLAVQAIGASPESMTQVAPAPAPPPNPIANPAPSKPPPP